MSAYLSDSVTATERALYHRLGVGYEASKSDRPILLCKRDHLRVRVCGARRVRRQRVCAERVMRSSDVENRNINKVFHVTLTNLDARR